MPPTISTFSVWMQSIFWTFIYIDESLEFVNRLDGALWRFVNLGLWADVNHSIVMYFNGSQLIKTSPEVWQSVVRPGPFANKLRHPWICIRVPLLWQCVFTVQRQSTGPRTEGTMRVLHFKLLKYKLLASFAHLSFTLCSLYLFYLRLQG